MNPIYKQEEARHYCSELIHLIETGVIELSQITPVSEERKNQGIMVGSLVCIRNFQKIVLSCVSGISKKINVPEKNRSLLKYQTENDAEQFEYNGITHIIVPSIVNSDEINHALKKNDKLIHQLTEKINHGEKSLIPERTILTDESLKFCFSLYNFNCWNGKKISLNTIIKNHNNRLPPTGTGDCCAPKLLSYAFEKKFKILSMDEVFFGGNTKNRINGNSYTSCDDRCGYILPSILGLNILYKDSSIIVINKQSGLLSVPGKGEEKIDSVSYRIKQLFPETIEQPAVHRLDMETSGVMVYALTESAHRELRKQFEEGTVHKKYEALLDGVLEKGEGKAVPKNNEKSGCIQLKFRLDTDNRPLQIYDEINGKSGITEWQKEGIEYYNDGISEQKRKVTRITFIPLTGRTHQLRLASSHINGFGIPIVGDSLYGNKKTGERLMLHAKEINFVHPVSGEKMHFECKPDF